MDVTKIEVKVTHVINPNRFFCCDLSNDEKAETLRQFEQFSYPQHCANPFRPKIFTDVKQNDLVCYLPPASGKWIRCNVDSTAVTPKGKKLAMLWAIDYGKPASTLQPDELVILPEENRQYESMIFEAGLSILPAMQQLSKHKNKLELVAQDVWSDESLMFFDKCIKESSAIYFRPSQSLGDDEITFGELIIQKPSGEVFELSRKMCEQQMATSEMPRGEKFINLFNRSMTAVIERWNDNKRNGGAVNSPDMLMVTDIADPPDVEAKKLRKLFQSFNDAKMIDEEAKELNKSFEKVTQWFRNNEGIEKENDLCSLPLDGPSTSFESIQLSIPSTSKSPTSVTSIPRLIPSTSKSPSFVTSSPRYVPRSASPRIEFPIEPKLQPSMKPMSQILKEHRDMSMKKNVRTSSSNSISSGSLRSRPTQKIILVPAGGSMNTNLKSPPYVDENFEIVEEGVEALNSLHQMPQGSTAGESSDSNNPMAPFITNNNQPQKSDCCIHQTIPAPRDSNSPVKKIVESTEFVEKWMELKVGDEYPVIVSSFGSCSSFFVQLINDSDGWEDMMQMLKDLETYEPLKTTSVGTFCLVEFNHDLLRAKIIRSSETSVMCFGLDTAELIYFHNERIRAYEIPPEILNFMPFQAINCRLIGIKAPLDFAWTQFIYSKIVKRMCQQRVRVVRKMEKNPEIIPWGLQNAHSYEVALFENGSGDGETVGDVLVKYQLADYEL